MDVSGRIGAGGMLSLLPYTDLELSRSGYKDMLVGAMGPAFGGLGARLADGAGLMASGDYWRGLQTMLPGAIGNGLKAYGAVTEGVTKRNGDLELTKDEVGYFDALLMTAGLPTNVITDRNQMVGATIKASKFYDGRESGIRRDYLEAYRSGDAEGIAEARSAWESMNAGRRNIGLKPVPLQNLLTSVRDQRKREREVVGGVPTTKETKGFVEMLR